MTKRPIRAQPGENLARHDPLRHQVRHVSATSLRQEQHHQLDYIMYIGGGPTARSHFTFGAKLQAGDVDTSSVASDGGFRGLRTFKPLQRRKLRRRMSSAAAPRRPPMASATGRSPTKAAPERRQRVGPQRLRSGTSRPRPTKSTRAGAMGGHVLQPGDGPDRAEDRPDAASSRSEHQAHGIGAHRRATVFDIDPRSCIRNAISVMPIRCHHNDDDASDFSRARGSVWITAPSTLALAQDAAVSASKRREDEGRDHGLAPHARRSASASVPSTRAR